MLRATPLLLALCCALSIACKEDPPPPSVSVGTTGRAVAPPSADAGPSAEASPADAGAEAPEEQAAALPEADPDRPDYLADTTLAQQELLEAAKAAMDAGDNPGAQKALALLAKSEPMSGAKVSGIIALSDLHIQAGQPKLGLALLEDLIRKTPPLPEVHFVLGRAYKESARIENAILAFQEALRLQPLLLRAHVEIGGLFQQLGESERSAAAFLEYERTIYKYSALLEDPQTHPEDKLKIAEAFSFLPDDRASTALLKAITEPNEEVRLAIIQAIGQVGMKSALPPLQALLEKSEDPRDSAALTEAIKLIEASPQEPDPSLGPTFVAPGSAADAGH